MDYQIVILTPTYNRSEELMNLFYTLCKQINKNFVWFIVDDGSPNDIRDIIEKMREQSEFTIRYEKKNNGGKSSSINYAIDRLTNRDFLIIIDDDELLYENATVVISQYIEKYSDSNIGAIDFNRAYSNGEIIGKPVFSEDYVMTVQTRRKKNITSDGYTGYFVSRIGECRFPIFEGEKFVGPSVLMMLVSMNYSILWASPALGYTEYLEDGLTRQGRKLRLKSPRSMAYYCILMQSRDTGLLYRFVYSVLYYAYLYYAKLSSFSTGIEYKLFAPFISKPAGFLLAKYWRFKYN